VAPFPYFGGKRRVAAEVWRRFGRVWNQSREVVWFSPACLGAAQPGLFDAAVPA